jgi:hypothetical protein
MWFTDLATAIHYFYSSETTPPVCWQHFGNGPSRNAPRNAVLVRSAYPMRPPIQARNSGGQASSGLVKMEAKALRIRCPEGRGSSNLPSRTPPELSDSRSCEQSSLANDVRSGKRGTFDPGTSRSGEGPSIRYGDHGCPPSNFRT